MGKLKKIKNILFGKTETQRELEEQFVSAFIGEHATALDVGDEGSSVSTPHTKGHTALDSIRQFFARKKTVFPVRKEILENYPNLEFTVRQPNRREKINGQTKPLLVIKDKREYLETREDGNTINDFTSNNRKFAAPIVDLHHEKKYPGTIFSRERVFRINDINKLRNEIGAEVPFVFNVTKPSLLDRIKGDKRLSLKVTFAGGLLQNDANTVSRFLDSSMNGLGQNGGLVFDEYLYDSHDRLCGARYKIKDEEKLNNSLETVKNQRNQKKDIMEERDGSVVVTSPIYQERENTKGWWLAYVNEDSEIRAYMKNPKAYTKEGKQKLKERYGIGYSIGDEVKPDRSPSSYISYISRS